MAGLIHACRAASFSTSSNGSPRTVCMAERMMTGNADAYLSAFRIDFLGVGVEPVRTSDRHCRKRNR